MNPELQAIQAKYKNKKDNDSMMAMNEETKEVYAKYGVSPSGSCVQLLIQMPILFALYRVIYAMPAYVSKIGDTFRVLADKIISVDNGSFLQNSGIETITKAVSMYGKSMGQGSMQNGIVDVLNMLSSSDMKILAEHYNLTDLKYNGEYILSQIGANGEVITRGLIDRYNNFLGINIANSPSFMVSEAWNAEGGIQWLMIIAALAIPLLSALTQWINTKLMPQASSNNDKNKTDQQNSMEQSMKMMNTMMPIMSAFFCYTLPAGMGLYWIAGSVVRSIQQIVINRHIDKMDIDEVIKKNIEKRNKKLEKAGIDPKTLNKNATINTRNVNAGNKSSMTSKAKINMMTQEEKDEAMKKSTEYYNKNAKPGSLAAKANMVKQYNEKNNK